VGTRQSTPPTRQQAVRRRRLPARRPSKGDLQASTRVDILQSAARTFRRLGYHGATVEQIAAALHMKKGNLYYYFENKEDILFACHQYSLDRLMELVDQLQQGGLSADQKVRRMIVSFVHTILDELHGTALFLDLEALSPAHLKTVIVRRDRFDWAMRQVLQQGWTRASSGPATRSCSPSPFLAPSTGSHGGSQGPSTSQDSSPTDSPITSLQVEGTLLPEHTDAVRVGALAVVVDTPARRGLGEFLRIDQHEDKAQARLNPARYHVLLQSNAAASHLTYFECDVTAGLQHAGQFHEHLRHRRAPILDLFPDRQLDFGGIDATKPAAAASCRPHSSRRPETVAT
jgi:AcrR family transcriptional regulator